MQRVKELHYHRNGISGHGFYVGIVKDEKRDMLVIRVPKEEGDPPMDILCFAFDLALLDERKIAFIENSWRGDHYHEVMDRAIAKKEKA
jgi:hypothetical protein